MDADRTSFGFRLKRNAQDAAAYTFQCLSRKDSTQWILSLFTMISDENQIHIEAKMTDRIDQIGLILQLVRFDPEFIGGIIKDIKWVKKEYN